MVTGNEIAQKSLNVDPESTIFTDPSPRGLYNQMLSGRSADGIGQLQDGAMNLMLELTYTGGAINQSTVNSLFEASYSYGAQIERMSFDEAGIQLVAAICQEIEQTQFQDLYEVSEEARPYLPEDIGARIWQRNENAGKPRSEVVADIFLSGLAAGILAYSSDQVIGSETQISAATTTTTTTQGESLYVRKQKLLLEITQAPDVLAEVLRGIRTVKDLENIELFINQVFTEYKNKRVTRIEEAKRGSKYSYTNVVGENGSRIYDTRWYGVWDIDYVDAAVEVAQQLLPDPEIVDKKTMFAIANRLAKVNLFAEVLTNDVRRGEIPTELETLIDAYVLEAGAEESLSDFMNEQIDQLPVAVQIQKYMEETAYWKMSKRKQTVTVDRYQITEEQCVQIEDVNRDYLDYMSRLTGLYNVAVTAYDEDEQARLFVDKLEGGLPQELVPYTRRLMRIPGGIDSLRFDLIQDRQGDYFVGEAQIMSGGTPPAILYRQAFESVQSEGPDSRFVDEGILNPFVERLYERSEQPVVLILYSERPYSSDISKTTSFAGNSSFEDALRAKGITVSTGFAKDTEVREDGKLYFKEGEFADKPITTIYNRADYVSDKAIANIGSAEMQAIIDLVEQGELDAFPLPLPILYGKGIYAMIWDADFESVLEQELGKELLLRLRQITPRTYWVDQDFSQIEGFDPKGWIRKGSYQHATQGLIMGADEPEKLLAQLAIDTQKPYSAVIQEYVDSATPTYRVLKKYRIEGGRSIKLIGRSKYRMRVEPTSIKGKVREIFITGNVDRVVHGSEDSIMTVAQIV
jgi:hypothetical protein